MAEAVTTLKGRADDILGTGRRKTSCARVRLRPGQGTIVINSRPYDEYFRNVSHQNAVVAALLQTGKREQVDIIIRVDGGGITGQADACKLGIARALKKSGEDMDKLRENALLTRDGRMKERKKYGLRGARRGTQFSKR
ncbi:MAG: 30S ribosomal protein S9 [Thermoguttaceae bacterium]